MSFRRWSCVGAGVVAMAVVISACGGGEANPLAPSQGVNEPPRVLDIVSDPATVPFGTASHVTVTAEDPNGDALIYEYAAQHGHVGGQGAAVIYTNDGDETAVSDTIRVTIRDARGAITISAIGLGLGKNPPPYGENPFPRRPTPAPTPSPTPKPAPTPKPPKPPKPTPTPTPTPEPPANHPPTVSISGGASCHPSPSTPCTVSVTANASDPDGDSLSYSWSGCVSGSGKTASCTVTALSTFTATVEVSDGRGGEASATHQVAGLNDAPSVVAESLNDAVACRTQVAVGFSVSDDQPGGSCNVAQVTGRCTLKKTTCGADGFIVTVTTTTDHSGGSCIIKGASWTDPWGAKANDDTRFDVQACP